MTGFIPTWMEYDGIRCYFFNEAPPENPRLYFKQSHLWQMLLYGSLAAPYTPPQHTIFPGDGQVGRWTLKYGEEKVEALHEIAKAPFGMVKEKLLDILPEMLMRYEDFATDKSTVWRLTDDVVMREHDNHLRLGVWPD
jgi:hypothetical protein